MALYFASVLKAGTPYSPRSCLRKTRLLPAPNPMSMSPGIFITGQSGQSAGFESDRIRSDHAAFIVWPATGIPPVRFSIGVPVALVAGIVYFGPLRSRVPE